MKVPAMEVAGVMRVYGEEYIGLYGDRMPAIHRKAMSDITACGIAIPSGPHLGYGRNHVPLSGLRSLPLQLSLLWHSHPDGVETATVTSAAMSEHSIGSRKPDNSCCRSIILWSPLPCRGSFARWHVPIKSSSTGC